MSTYEVYVFEPFLWMIVGACVWELSQALGRWMTKRGK